MPIIQAMGEIGAAAQRPRAAFDASFVLDTDLEVRVGVSVGEARWPLDGDGMDALLRHANATMYREKTRARSR